jgi:SnoaL-like domain
VYEYARLLDTGDVSGAADLFAVQGSMARPMMPDVLIEGRENVRSSLLTRPKTLLTKHLVTNVMIDVDSPSLATGLSYLTMISTTPGDCAPPFMSQGPVYFGQMHDRFILEEGQWRFLERRGSIQMTFRGAGS